MNLQKVNFGLPPGGQAMKLLLEDGSYSVGLLYIDARNLFCIDSR